MLQNTFIRLWLLTTVVVKGSYDRGTFAINPQDVAVGTTIAITGKLQSSGGEYTIDLLYADLKTIALHFKHRTDTGIVLNSYDGAWATEEVVWGTIVADVAFVTEFTFQRAFISIKMNGSRLTDFTHRMAPDKITAIGIQGKFTPNCIFTPTQACAATL